MSKKYLVWLFPLAGAATGIMMYIFGTLCWHCHFDSAVFALIGAVLPVLLSGAMPLYGFFKTVESLTEQLYGKVWERKEDGQSHFSAVIVTVSYYMLYAGGLALIEKERQILLLGAGYVISRVLAVMTFLWFPKAEEEKDIFLTGTASRRRMFRFIFGVVLALLFFTCMLISPVMGVLEALLFMWVWTYCYYMSKKRFGGITKNAAGYFLALCELVAVLFIGMLGKM